MQFFCYHRDRHGSNDLRRELLEQHWSYMDGYASAMIARGPTFDGDTITGSVHIVDLSDAPAARSFAFDEPGYQAGVYREVMLRRWEDLLGRTMWDFSGGTTDGNRYLVVGLGSHGSSDLSESVDHDELIAWGSLLSDDGVAWLGTAVLVRAVDADVAAAVLTGGLYDEIEIHRWQFVGRRLHVG